MTIALRALEGQDIPAADETLRAAFRTGASFAPHVRRISRLADGAVLVAEDEGEIVGTGCFVRQAETAVIGLMACRPDRMRRGVGASLLRALEALATEQGARGFVLDATTDGAPLYAKHGYVTVDSCEERLAGASSQTGAQDTWDALDAAVLRDIVAFDADRVGVGRAAMVAAYVHEHPTRVLVEREAGAVVGYAVAQAALVGPFVARDEAVAARLLGRASELAYVAPHRLLVHGRHPFMHGLLDARGYARGRSLAHMRKGDVTDAARFALVCGKASFATG